MNVLAALPRAAVLGVLGLAPVVFWPAASDIFGLPKLAVVVVGVVVAAVAVVAGGAPGWRSTPVPAVARPLAVFVGAFALATAFSISPATSVLGSYERYNGLLPLLVHVLLASLIVVLWWSDPKATWAIAAAAVAGGVGLAVYVLLQVAGIDPIDWVEKSGGVVRYQAGTMGNSNFAAAYLGTILPLVWPLHRAASQTWVRLLVAVAGVAVAAALVATKGRGGLVAAGVGLVVALALVRPPLPADPARRRAVTAGGAVGLLALGLVAVYAVTSTDLLRTDSFEVRKREWAGGLAVFADRPILGTGPDTFFLRYPGHRTLRDGRELGLQIADKPHNLAIEYAATTGIVGLAAFGVLLGSVGLAAIRGLRRVPEIGDRVLPAGFVAATGGYFAQSLFSFEVPALAGLGWALLAGVVVHVDPRLAARREAKPTKRKGKARQEARPGAVVVGAVAALAVIIVGLLGRFVLADLHAGRSLASSDGDRALDHAERAASLHPWQPAYALSAGGAAEELGATTERDERRPEYLADAAAHYRSGLELQEDNVLLLAGLARTLTLTARSGVDRSAFAEADATWQRSIELDPLDWELHLGYGLMLNSWANAGADRRAAAAAALQRSVDIRPEQASTWSTLALVHESLGQLPEAAYASARGAALAPEDPEARALADRLATGPPAGP